MNTFATRLLLIAIASVVLPGVTAGQKDDLAAPNVRVTILADNSVAEADGVKAIWDSLAWSKRAATLYCSIPGLIQQSFATT